MMHRKSPKRKIDAVELLVQILASIVAGIVVEVICRIFNI